MDEFTPLIRSTTNNDNQKNLSKFFAVICIVDVFGVLPIISLPGAIIKCGLLAIPLVITIFFIQMYTAILLGKCWIIAENLDKSIVKKCRYPYAALAEMTYGKNIASLVTILLDFTIFGAGIPNIIVAAQNLEIFGLKMTSDHFNFSHCYWIIILGIILCPFLWLGSPKDMKVLCTISVFIVFSISVTIWICIYFDDSTRNNSSNLFEDSLFRNIVSAYGILAFQFDIHPMLLTIQVDMKDKTSISQIVFYGFLVTTILCTMTTIFAALKYGANTYANILEGLPPSFLLYCTVLLVTMQLCLTSSISNSALYQHIEDYLNIARDFNYKRCILRSSLTALAVFIAESVPKFDFVMSLIGGTLTGPLVFIFPPLFYIKLTSLQKQHLMNVSLQTANHFMYHCETNFLNSTECNDNYFVTSQRNNYIKGSNNYYEFLFKISVAVSVIIFGVFATCATTYINFIDAKEYVNFSPSCLYNFTASTNISI